MEKNTQEIDLIYLYRKIKHICTKINFSIFRLMQLVIKNIILLTIVVVSMFFVGYLIEKKQPKLKLSELIVSPNFQSNDYLYERIENFDQNKKIFSEKYPTLCAIKKIKIKKIENYYDLVNKDLEVFKTLTDHGRNFKNFIEEKTIEKDFRYHKIEIISTDTEDTKKVIADFFEMLNNAPYIETKRKRALDALIERRNQLQLSIVHINNLLERLGDEKHLQKSSELNVNTYAQLHEVIELKEKYSVEISRLNTQIIEGEKTIYPVSEIIGADYNPFILYKLRYLLPTIGVFLLFLGYRIKRFYKKYALLANSNNS